MNAAAQELDDALIIADLLGKCERLQLENDELRRKLETARQITRAAMRTLHGKKHKREGRD